MMGATSRIMLLPTPRVIIIDDRKDELGKLARGLNFYGVSCLPILFKNDEIDRVLPCPYVRVIFADLHLIRDIPAKEHARTFGVLSGLLEDKIKPMGPYCIILWTKYPKIADGLECHLQNLKGVPQPFFIKVLDKNILLSKKSLDNRKLINKIKKIVAEIPQFDALFNWENRVLEAATGTMTSLLEMSVTPKKDSNKVLAKLLKSLGIAAISKKAFEEDPLCAVNEALLPILADHIASIRSQNNDQRVWKKAIKDADPDPILPDKLARLNKLLHIESEKVGKWYERGAVMILTQKYVRGKDKFKQNFGLTEDAAKKQFRYKDKDVAGNREKPCWVLVQSQAACDYAQRKEGMLPFYLGCLLQEGHLHPDSPPAALWRSPLFDWKKQNFFLHVHAGFPISCPKTEMKMRKPVFRLREQMLNSMIYHLHSHSARPGIISLRKKN